MEELTQRRRRAGSGHAAAPAPRTTAPPSNLTKTHTGPDLTSWWLQASQDAIRGPGGTGDITRSVWTSLESEHWRRKGASKVDWPIPQHTSGQPFLSTSKYAGSKATFRKFLSSGPRLPSPPPPPPWISG